MAKNNINLGTLSGKLGDNVFWRARGQQRVRLYFKKSDYAVNEEQSKVKAKFANLKSMYQWLPEPFKKACSLHKPGGNTYADFMRQYSQFDEYRDKEAWGPGRFIPVEAKISNGTLGTEIKTEVSTMVSWDPDHAEEYTTGIMFDDMKIDIVEEDYWATISKGFIKVYPFLREGDILHILFSWFFYDYDWGTSIFVDGFPFGYNNSLYATLTLNTRSSDTITDLTDGKFHFAQCSTEYTEVMGIHPMYRYFNSELYNKAAVVAGVMFERPGNTRQLRYTPAQLRSGRNPMNILSPAGQLAYRDLASHSYIKR